MSSNNDSFMLTTIDNPYHPYHDRQHWLAYDNLMGYNTDGLLARFTLQVPHMSDEAQEEEILKAIDRIVLLNPLGVHKKIRIDEEPNVQTSLAPDS